MDNNNIINNENNIDDNNDAINIPEIEEIYDPQFTFSFKILLILNTLGYIHSFFKSYELKNFSLCLWPIVNKAQYYRIITSHFYHFGFFDYLTTMIGLFFATKYLESEIGSIYTILIVFHGIIITSLFYLIIMWIFKTILRFLEYNFIYQSGFSSIDFCLYLSYYLLKKNYRRNISLSFIDLRGIHSVFFVIFIFQLITPSASIILNLCGTLSAFIIFNICKYFTLPRNYWVNETEKILGLSGKKNCCFKSFLGYYSISENETILNNVLEFDFFLDNINKNKKMIINDIKSKNKKNNPSQANNSINNKNH
jgi:membrane associated rhomboid family serine protease